MAHRNRHGLSDAQLVLNRGLLHRLRELWGKHFFAPADLRHFPRLSELKAAQHEFAFALRVWFSGSVLDEAESGSTLLQSPSTTNGTVIYAYIEPQNQPNVGVYGIHGVFGEGIFKLASIWG